MQNLDQCMGCGPPPVISPVLPTITALLSKKDARRDCMYAGIYRNATMALTCFFFFQVLLQNSSDTATREQLLHSYDMLMNPEKMGDCFNFFALLPHHRLVHPDKKDKPESKSPLPPVAGFNELLLK